MKDDPIVDEVIQARIKILESYNWDFKQMSRDVMKRQWQSGHKVVCAEQETTSRKSASNESSN